MNARVGTDLKPDFMLPRAIKIQKSVVLSLLSKSISIVPITNNSNSFTTFFKNTNNFTDLQNYLSKFCSSLKERTVKLGPNVTLITADRRTNSTGIATTNSELSDTLDRVFQQRSFCFIFFKTLVIKGVARLCNR